MTAPAAIRPEEVPGRPEEVPGRTDGIARYQEYLSVWARFQNGELELRWIVKIGSNSAADLFRSMVKDVDRRPILPGRKIILLFKDARSGISQVCRLTVGFDRHGPSFYPDQEERTMTEDILNEARGQMIHLD